MIKSIPWLILLVNRSSADVPQKPAFIFYYNTILLFWTGKVYLEVHKAYSKTKDISGVGGLGNIRRQSEKIYCYIGKSIIFG